APNSAVGTQANTAVDATTRLNFTFQNWDPDCRSTLEYCIRTIAVHEFGHALAFIHENDRPDNPSPGTCSDDGGPVGNRTLGAYDTHSVLYGCNPTWDHSGILSDGDLAGVQSIYGLPVPWSHADIGSQPLHGWASIVGANYSVTGSGNNVWDLA